MVSERHDSIFDAGGSAPARNRSCDAVFDGNFQMGIPTTANAEEALPWGPRPQRGLEREQPATQGEEMHQKLALGRCVVHILGFVFEPKWKHGTAI